MSKLIHSIERSKQVLAFDGIKQEKVHPTDIDALLEFDDTYLILFELKVKGSCIVPFGQRLALERICNNWTGSSNGIRKAFILYCEHDTKPDEIIYLKDCEVFEMYKDGKRIPFNNKVNVKEILKALSKKYNISKLSTL